MRNTWYVLTVLLLLIGCASNAPESDQQAQLGQKLDVQAGSAGTQTVWVLMKQQADLKSAAKIRDWSQRGKEVVRMLTSTAQSTQSPLAATLARSNATIKPFWIVNAMQVTADKATIATLATDPSVAGVYPDRVYELPPIKPGSTEPSVNGLEWGVTAVRAPDVWQTFGSRGEGIVVANIDTGVQFDHPALVRQYRGNQGNGTFDHNYNWFDPAHVCTGSAPCDNNNHGTHTMGTMVGQDATGDNQIGVAPGARWIAAKGCEQSSCSTASLLAAGQWVLAPTDLAGNNPRPDLRPNIVNNSWGGGGGDVWYRATVQAWVAAGIFPAFANGNNGPGCNSAGSPGDYDESYGVGAFAADGTIASFSSRGSGLGGITKPNISAPGVNVRSSIPGGGYASFQGTSMATPHVSGVVALLWSAAPTLVGDIAQTKALLSQTAIDTSDLSCGGTPTNNNVWGEGKIDAFASVNLAPRGPTGTLAGLVHTADGQAIAGASVSVQGPTQRSTVADSGGGFSLTLPVGTYDVTATAYGYLPTTLSAQTISVGNTTNVDLSLAAAPSFTLSGTVTGGGQPIAGAGVRLNGSPLSTVTDASGRYSFASVLAGTYSLLVSPTDRCVQSETRSVDVTQNLVADFALAARHDSFGYGCRSLSVAYVDATTPLSLTGDDSAVAVALPFAFPFYGNNYSTAYVSTNGHVNFSALDSTFTNTSLPNTATPNLAIYGFWDDLMVDSSSNILTQSVGTAPNRSFVIEYRNVAFYSGAGRVDFEIVLTEDGHVRLQYKALDSDLEKGSSATIGLENAGGTVAFQYAYNEVALLASQAIEFGLTSSDTTPPMVALTAPTEGSVLTGIASLSATASDDVAVSRVDFYSDFGTPTQALIFSDTQAPYAASWNTITVTQGAHSLTARAFDAAGNAGSSAAVNVTIDNPPDTVPPTVVITSPADGALLGRNVQVQVTASDNIAVQSVDLLVDGNVVATRTAAPYQFVWNSALVADGPHELEAIARDPAGNAGTSTPLPLVTDNTVPSLALTAPAPGTIIKGTTSITATASDVTGVDHVEFYVDGALLATDTTAPYAASWNTSAVI
ncbi:MAG TPA: Ig-like domain-containing protein, partial [Polyangiaceae bacterium]|nr:Ig-like domain-containing protein [Polyangiaceae bacterium]